jgi:putative CocE/NonD family hydrolase
VWPPRRGTTARRLYFQAGGRLAFEAPATSGANAFDRYVSDPANPVPYRHRPIPATYSPQGSGWPAWLVEDQRFVDDRPDVLTWETEPLAEDVTIAGDIVARLFVSTTGTDGDWVVKLIDVYPEQYPKDGKLAGRQLMVANEVLRGRFRSSFEKPAPLTPGQVTPLTIDLHSQNYRFLKGHRIMVQVQSTWFPLIDRNPQTFVPNIFDAKAADYRPATIRVYRSPRWSSSVEVHVVGQD